MRLYRDSSGDPRAHGEKGQEILARFLESDVQDSASLGRKILAAIDKVAGGHLDEWERTGNAYTLTLTPDGADIEPEMADTAEPLHLTLAELHQGVARWVEFLLSRE
ncbi:MAG TPA: YacL family protein [Thermoanaerobaculia bacterium]|jgi:uncharacterized protein YacL (UPF0231 family)|nr:YacL family protein [Thermoanaerobaculia bacterium]